MGIFTRLPWWSALPLSAGFGLMGIFAPDAVPEWIRRGLFWLGVALAFVGVSAGAVHFRPRGWWSRHVAWRFKANQPAYAPPVDFAQIQAEFEAAQKAEPPAKRISLTDPERRRISATLLATLDWLEGDFEQFIKPIRDMWNWPGILNSDGPGGVLAVAELARTRVQEMPQTFGAVFGKDRMADLDLVDINPMLIKSNAVLMGDVFHSFGSIAYAMKPDEPNGAAFQLTSKAFRRLFDDFQNDIDRTKEQIREVRRKMAQGEL